MKWWMRWLIIAALIVGSYGVLRCLHEVYGWVAPQDQTYGDIFREMMW